MLGVKQKNKKYFEIKLKNGGWKDFNYFIGVS